MPLSQMSPEKFSLRGNNICKFRNDGREVAGIADKFSRPLAENFAPPVVSEQLGNFFRERRRVLRINAVTVDAVLSRCRS